MTPSIYKAKQIQAKMYYSDAKPVLQRKPERQDYLIIGEHLILKFHTRKTVLSNTFIYNTH